MSQLQEHENRARKTRRVHTKSRNGCRQCKRRHIRCNEQRPACVNCSTAQLRCSYLDDNVSVANGSSSQNQRQEEKPKSVSAISRALNLEHLRLLHHFEVEMMMQPQNQLVAEGTDPAPLLRVVINSALSAPYLMDEILAFSALHLSTVSHRRNEKHEYSLQALELQTRALQHFNTYLPGPSEQKDGIAGFFFSSFLSMHMLFDIGAAKDVGGVLNRFIRFLDVQRGVRTVFEGNWHTIRDTGLKSIFDIVEASEKHCNEPRETDDACETLKKLTMASRASLGEEAYEATHGAIERLQWVQNCIEHLPEPLNLHILLAWPVSISTEYSVLLSQRRPESLLILAHWAFLLHQGRRFWVFGHVGEHLVKSITKYLE